MYWYGTPSHEPPDTVDSALICDSSGLPFACKYASARSCPMPAQHARVPPPERHKPTLPGVEAGVYSWSMVNGGVVVMAAVREGVVMRVSPVANVRTAQRRATAGGVARSGRARLSSNRRRSAGYPRRLRVCGIVTERRRRRNLAALPVAVPASRQPIRSPGTALAGRRREELAYLLRTATGNSDLCGPFQRGVPGRHIDDGESADEVPGLRIGAIVHCAVHSHHRCQARIAESARKDEDAGILGLLDHSARRCGHVRHVFVGKSHCAIVERNQVSRHLWAPCSDQTR